MKQLTELSGRNCFLNQSQSIVVMMRFVLEIGKKSLLAPIKYNIETSSRLMGVKPSSCKNLIICKSVSNILKLYQTKILLLTTPVLGLGSSLTSLKITIAVTPNT